MEPAVLKNKKGMTLIEVMIATLLFLIVSLALLQTSLISVAQNVQSNLRDEAVSVGETRMSQARSLRFNNTYDDLTGASDASALSSPPCPPGWNLPGVQINKQIGDVSVPFCTNLTVRAPGTDIREVDVTVAWTWRGTRYNQSFSTIVRRQTLS